MFMNGKIILGMMRISRLSVGEAEKLISCALECGIDFLDNADIYGGGESETLLGKVFANNKGLRQKVFLQSKCGICKGFYDFSKEHIIKSVEGSLKRLNADSLDALLLHRPDALVDFEELNETFAQLYKSGKVKSFGVSNMNSYQMELFAKYVKLPVKYNQVQLSIVHSHMVAQGLYVNMSSPESVDRAAGTLEYCRLKDIKVQAWSSLMASWEDGSFIDNPKYPELNAKLSELAEKYGVSKSAVAIAWILRLPQRIMPIVGTTSTEHLKQLAAAQSVRLTREEWYALFLSAGHKLP